MLFSHLQFLRFYLKSSFVIVGVVRLVLTFKMSQIKKEIAEKMNDTQILVLFWKVLPGNSLLTLPLAWGLKHKPLIACLLRMTVNRATSKVDFSLRFSF